MLRLLAQRIRTTDAAAACLQVLHAAERGQIAVLQEDAQRALQLSVDAGNVVLAHLAVKLGAEGTAELASNAVHWAWSSGRVKVLGILLSAGAPITHYIMSLVYEYMRPAVLEVLLRHGALPAMSEVFYRHPFGPKRCACPVLRLLQCNAKVGGAVLGLLQLAGLRLWLGCMRGASSHFACTCGPLERGGSGPVPGCAAMCGFLDLSTGLPSRVVSVERCKRKWGN